MVGHNNLCNVASTIYTDRIYQSFCTLLKNFTPATNKWVMDHMEEKVHVAESSTKTEKWSIEEKYVLTCKLGQARIAS